MKELETKDEFDEIIAENKDKLVVIDFYAAWCGPCKMIGPKFEKMEADYPNAVFVKIDVDNNEETAEECEVEAMPCFQLYKDGVKVDEMTGANADALQKKIDTHYEE